MGWHVKLLAALAFGRWKLIMFLRSFMDFDDTVYELSIVTFAQSDLKIGKSVLYDRWAIYISPSGSEIGELHEVRDFGPAIAIQLEYQVTKSTRRGQPLSIVEAEFTPFKF